jgi:hypothetical protein
MDFSPSPKSIVASKDRTKMLAENGLAADTFSISPAPDSKGFDSHSCSPIYLIVLVSPNVVVVPNFTTALKYGITNSSDVCTVTYNGHNGEDQIDLTNDDIFLVHPTSLICLTRCIQVIPLSCLPLTPFRGISRMETLQGGQTEQN